MIGLLIVYMIQVFSLVILIGFDSFEQDKSYMDFKTKRSVLVNLIPFYFVWRALMGFIKHFMKLK